MAEVIVTITRPQLTPEERQKRMEAIKRAAYQLVLETEKTKKRNAQNNKNMKGAKKHEQQNNN